MLQKRKLSKYRMFVQIDSESFISVKHQQVSFSPTLIFFSPRRCGNFSDASDTRAV
jgi:hypothetical protein